MRKLAYIGILLLWPFMCHASFETQSQIDKMTDDLVVIGIGLSKAQDSYIVVRCFPQKDVENSVMLVFGGNVPIRHSSGVELRVDKRPKVDRNIIEFKNIKTGVFEWTTSDGFDGLVGQLKTGNHLLLKATHSAGRIRVHEFDLSAFADTYSRVIDSCA